MRTTHTGAAGTLTGAGAGAARAGVRAAGAGTGTGAGAGAGAGAADWGGGGAAPPFAAIHSCGEPAAAKSLSWYLSRMNAL